MAEPPIPGDRCAGATLVVMAKAPIPGLAKTRLAPRLGPEGAAALHAVLLDRALRAATSSGFASVALWCAPGRRSPYFAALQGAAGLELRDQPAGDLGARMHAAFAHHLAAGGPVVMMGTDCPELGPPQLASARAALAGADAVIVPALDGGYAALGLRRLDGSLFEGVPWGGPEVMTVTRARLRSLGWSTRELPALRDVDVPEDLEWLRASGILDAEERARLEPYLRVDTR
jgi:rSAM/selenodomain-associated transferase 1